MSSVIFSYCENRVERQALKGKASGIFTRVNDERNSENLSVSIDVLGDIDWWALDSCRVGG